MVTAFQFFVAYLICDTLCMVLTIIIASHVSRDIGSETEMRYFFLVLTSYMFFTLFDVIWGFVAYSGLVEVGEVLLSVVNGLSLSAVGFAAYFWLCFTLARFKSKLMEGRASRLLFALPAILIPVVHVIGCFVGQNIITLPDGTWTYGYCHLTITVLQLFYIATATIVAFRRYTQASSRAEKRMALTFVAFMVPFVVAGIVDAFVINTPVATACMMVSLTFIMMSMQESRISTDALTGLNNRRRADEFFEESMAHVSPENPLCLFLIDLDDFKRINDTFGHLEGDNALITTAGMLRRVCAQENCFAARWGGDEFLIIRTHASDLDPDRLVNLIHDTMATAVSNAKLEYDLRCSVGYAICKSNVADCSSVISQADIMMYRTKNAKS